MRTSTLNWKAGLLATILAAGCAVQAQAAEKNVICVKTNAGQYVPVVRVSMMAVADGASTFEIVLKDGPSLTGVESISFEKHLVDIDFSKYKEDASGSISVDYTKKIYLMTSTGKYFTFKTLPTLEPVAGTSLFNVVSGSTTEPGVEYVYFVRSNNEDELGISAPLADNYENLTLETPVSTQLQLSGCGDADRAVVYATNGQQVAQAGVANGSTTVQVGHLPAGTYVVQVGKKSLKFIKK